MKTDFFITYHHSDELAARWITYVLKEVPFSIFMESWDFLPGQHPIEKIEHMSAISRCAIVLLSERFLQAGVDAVSWQAVTEKFAIGDTMAVILFRIDSCDVEKAMGAVPYIDLFDIKVPKAKKEAETRKRLLTAVGSPTPDKIETKRLPVIAITTDEVLEKRKAELDELLDTTIKHNYHMKLDLEQEVEKEVEVVNNETGEIEKRKQWVWEAVALETVLRDRNNYILVNPSGMGKTTFLTYASHVLLDRAGDYSYVPLSFACIDLNKLEGSIPSFIQKEVESLYNNSRTALVRGDWENLCVLLDALDQARDVDDIVSSLQLLSKSHYYKKAKIILSSRENTADKVKVGFKKIRLKLPEDDEVRNYLGEENYKKLEVHIAATRELVTVPVLLEMLKTITEKGYDTSKLWNRAELYNEFTKILVDQERNKLRFWQDDLAISHFREHELEQALEKIAFFSLVENRILEIDKEKLVEYCETPEKKEALLNIGIILELFEDREQKIVFRHQSFQAYFAARYIYFRRPELFEKLTADISFFYHDVWYEVMRLYVSLKKDPENAGTKIDNIYQREDKDNEFNQAVRLIFIVFLVSEARVSIKKVQKLHEALRGLLTNARQYLNFFILNIDKFNQGNIEQRKSLFITFLPLLRDGEIRSVAVGVLGTICTEKEFPLLKPMLSDEDEDVKNTALQVLRNIGKDRTIRVRQILFGDKDENESRFAAFYRWKPEATVNDIPLREKMLRDKEWNARLDATKFFGNVGTVNDIPLLKPLLKDEMFWVRIAAAEALGKIGTANHIPLLYSVLRDEVKYVRLAATKAVEQIYKRSTPELSIDDVLLKSEKKEPVFLKTTPIQPLLHILHISDIHYALEEDPSITRIFYEFLEDIKKWQNERPGEKIHAICLTGDIAYDGQKNQYISISEKINKILETTGCSKDNLFIIPGNHDVRNYDNISPECKTILEQVCEKKINIDSHVLSNFENYREFHEKFRHFYGFVEISGYLNSLTEKANDTSKTWYSRKLKDFPVRIIGLNSALFCLKDYSQREKLRMGTSQFHEAYFQDKLGDTESGELAILLTHHPIDWLAETEKDELKTMIDRYSVIHLHGHVHRLAIDEVRSYSGSTYILIGTGSIYGEKGTKDINTYHIMTLDFHKEKIHIWGRRWVPEFGMWTTFADNTNNIFSFPGKHR